MAKKYRVVVNGKEYIVEIEEIRETKVSHVDVPKVGIPRAEVPKIEKEKEVRSELSKPERSPSSDGEVRAPMAGVIVKILVREGQSVTIGDKLLVFEAMKMENELVSERSGVVKEIKVKEGDHVETGQVLMVIE